MEKLSNVLNVSANNIKLSPRVDVFGFNHLVGGYPSRILGHQILTSGVSMIYIAPIEDQVYMFGDKEGYSADYFRVGQTVYILTDPDSTVQTAVITAITKDETGTAPSTILKGIQLTLDRKIESNGSTSTTAKMWKPENFIYKFTASSLTANGSVQMAKLVVSNIPNMPAKVVAMGLTNATGSGTATANLKITMKKNGEAFTSFSYGWNASTGELTITFSSSQAATPDAEYIIYLNEAPAAALCTVECPNFDYTLSIEGEYNMGSGCNSTVSGNSNASTGDFSTVAGITNFNMGIFSDIGGVSNKVNGGTNVFIRGVNNFAVGRDIYVFGSRNEAYTDGVLQIGGLCKSYGMNCVQVGNNLENYGRMNVQIGLQLKSYGDYGTMIGRDLVNKATNGTLIGVHGTLPEYAGTLAADTAAFSSGAQSGVHYRDAIAIATGVGTAEDKNNPHSLGMIFSKYKWKKNPSFPWGNDSAAIAERANTTENRQLLEYAPLLQILDDVHIAGKLSCSQLKPALHTTESEGQSLYMNFDEKLIQVVYPNELFTRCNAIIDMTGDKIDGVKFGIMVVAMAGTKCTFSTIADDTYDVLDWIWYNEKGEHVTSMSFSSLGADVFLVACGEKAGLVATVAKKIMTVSASHLPSGAFTTILQALFN